LDWLGVRRFSVSTGPRADLDDLIAPFTVERRQALEQAIHAIDERFQDLVATTRNLPREALPGLAGGRVYTGEEAVANKLADGYGTLLTAVKAARARAGAAQPLPIERHPKEKGLLEQLGFAKPQTYAPFPGGARVARWLATLQRKTPTVLAWCNIAP
jgi:protease-4